MIMVKRVSMILLACLFILSGCSSQFNDYNDVIKANWDISLPTGFVEYLAADTGVSFSGDGDRYHVFEYEEKLNSNELIDYYSTKSSYMESKVGQILDLIGVADEDRPDFTKDYVWYTINSEDDYNDNIYIIYFEDENRIYVAEEFF